MPVTELFDKGTAHLGADALHSFWEGVAKENDALMIYVGDPRSQEIEHDVAATHEAMTQELLEYIDNHEVMFFMEKRRFFVVGCREHAQAKAIFKRGEVPAKFRCTLRGDACPMQKLSCAGDGRTLRFLKVVRG